MQQNFIKTKVVVLGDVNVGKSSLVHQMRFKSKLENHTPTIAATYHVIKRDGYSFEFWDTAGSERFSQLMPMYVRASHILLCVYDVTSISSLEKLERDITRHREESSIKDAIWFFVGNKCDLKDYMAGEFDYCSQVAEEIVKKSPLKMRHFLVSADSGEGVEKLLDAMVHEMQKGPQIQLDQDPKIVKIGAEAFADISLFKREKPCCFQ